MNFIKRLTPKVVGVKINPDHILIKSVGLNPKKKYSWKIVFDDSVVLNISEPKIYAVVAFKNAKSVKAYLNNQCFILK